MWIPSAAGELPGDRQHGQPDQDVEHLPGARPGQQRGGQSRAVPESGEPQDAPEARAHREPPLARRAMVRGDRPEQEHGVEVDVRVEPGQGHRLHERAAQPRLRVGRRRQRLRAAGAPQRPDAVRREEGDAEPAHDRQRGRRVLHDRSDAGHAGADQHQVGDRADRDHRPDVLAEQTLAEHESVLCPDRDDQRQTGQQTGEGGVQHSPRLEGEPRSV